MFLCAILAATLIQGPVAESGSFRGEAAIEPLGARGVILYVDTNRDNSFDHVFRLQVEGPREAIDADVKLEHEMSVSTSPFASGPTYFANAHVEFAQGYVRVVAGGEAVELFVEGSQSPAWDPAGARVWRSAGYGLIHEIRESGIAIKKRDRTGSITAEYCDATSNCDPGDTDGGGGTSYGGTPTQCDAGGPGSTSCMVSNGGGTCNSTCGVGYYSCCMYGAPPKCRCIRGG